MLRIARVLTFTGLFIFCIGNAHAVSLFGAYTFGSDLEPVRSRQEDGGAGASSASISFTTYQAEVDFIPGASYLPNLRASAVSEDAPFDDDRTNAEAQAYQVFTSSVDQTVYLDITFDSVVTENTSDPNGTSAGVLANVYVFGGDGFGVFNSGCFPRDVFMFDSTYMCGERIATSNEEPRRNFANLFNDLGDQTLTDTLTFSVSAGEQFGIFAELSAGAFNGTADAFNTLSLAYSAINPATGEADPNARFDLISAVEIPGNGVPSAIPLPAGAWLFATGLLGILGFRRKLKA